MKWLVPVIAAIALYALLAACVMEPNASKSNASAVVEPPLSADDMTSFPDPAVKPVAQHGHMSLNGLPYRCVGMQIQRVDWIDKYKQSIDEIAAVGADTVKFVVDARMENGRSSRIYLDLRMTPTFEQLTDLIRHAKEKKLRVILMPIVLLDAPVGNEWRGTIHPEDWHDWWDSYRSMLAHYATIAQVEHVDVLVIGSELVSTESNTTEWTKTINSVRELFKGRLTYSSNWDHYTSVPFWDQLDLIGMNSYWKLGKDRNATVAEIEDNWRDIQVDLFKFQSEVKKPIMFLEIGWFSQANVAYEPWDYTKEEEPLDLDLQKRLYEGFFNVWWGEPRLGGFSVWEWPPDASGEKDRGYTPHGKPAEKVLREYLSKPRWEVK